MSFAFYMPEISLFGDNAIEEMIGLLKKKNFKKTLIVTDKFFNQKTKFISNLQSNLRKQEIENDVFDNVSPNPTEEEVMQGLESAINFNADVIIGFGGGSPNDAAKVIALLKTNGGKPEEYEGVNKSKQKSLPLVIINTTSGTATEVTKNAVITNQTKHIKMVIIDENITPMIAVNDPSITKTMPKTLTANSGMDALTHAIESYMTTHDNPITMNLALIAIQIINENLPVAVNNLDNLNAREGMVYGQFIAGMSFNSGGLGLVHAMSHPISAHWGIDHGLANAILLPHILRINLEATPKKAKKLAQYLGEDKYSSDTNSIKFVVNKIIELSKTIGIPKNLKELGIDDSKFEMMAQNTLEDPCYPGNPCVLSKKQIVDLYQYVLNYTY